MKVKMQKSICILLSVMTMLSVLFATGMSSYAADTTNITSIRKGIYSTVFNVADYKYGSENCTNLGGISVGAANNRLFAVKSNEKEQTSTFYYYSNIYDTKKAPKRIVFKGSLLGHANAMAVDDDHVYVTRFNSKTGGGNTEILQISRKAIGLLKDKAVVSSDTQKINGERICRIIAAKKYNSTTKKYEAYEERITAISKYSYNKETKEAVFLINAKYDGDRSILRFKKAVLNGTNLVVQDKVYTVYNTVRQTSVSQPRKCVLQDIFYDKSYGLLIPIWHPNEKQQIEGRSDQGVLNSILQINLNRPETKFAKVRVPDGKGGYKAGVYRVKTYDSLTSDDVVMGTFNAIKPTAVITVNASSDKFFKFELESVAFVTKTADKKSSAFRVIMSCNKQEWNSTTKKTGKMCDAIVELSNAKDVMLKL